ncbi:hypothetical protein Nepgr_009864 [Nepenthes gracilis]|uniref:Uncharacterized protein n=1 Tax=Nepenthes gracilis TaxID=150966 RepID=A0AAD3XKR6_NEPGR|nr:hypothetical protein Nepgr_009864 [Nepenthes gracilis]
MLRQELGKPSKKLENIPYKLADEVQGCSLNSMSKQEEEGANEKLVGTQTNIEAHRPRKSSQKAIAETYQASKPTSSIVDKPCIIGHNKLKKKGGSMKNNSRYGNRPTVSQPHALHDNSNHQPAIPVPTRKPIA